MLNDEARQVPHDALAWNQAFAQRPWRMARLFSDAQGPKQHVLSLDCYGLSIGPGCGRQDRQRSPYGDHGRRSPTASRRPRQRNQGKCGGKYIHWLLAAVQRWKEHSKVYRKLSSKPVLFTMAEKNVYADALAEYLRMTQEFGFVETLVRIIYTDKAGEISERFPKKRLKRRAASTKPTTTSRSS